MNHRRKALAIDHLATHSDVGGSRAKWSTVPGPLADSTANLTGSDNVDRIARTKRFLNRVTHEELKIVRLAVHCARTPMIKSISSITNRLGNGWLYGFALIAMVLSPAGIGPRLIIAASLAVSICFLVYAWVKPAMARLRPCDCDPLLSTTIQPLDKYSFPSGHVMTACAVAVPVMSSFPAYWAFILPCLTLISWARVACGHHYPSDVIIGACLGVCVSLPISNWVL